MPLFDFDKDNYYSDTSSDEEKYTFKDVISELKNDSDYIYSTQLHNKRLMKKSIEKKETKTLKGHTKKELIEGFNFPRNKLI